MIKKQRISYLAPSKGSWIIPNISYRGEIGTYRIFEKMTPSMTQDKLSELYEKEKPKGNPHPIDSILHFAICNQAYNLKDETPKESEQLRTFLQKGFRKYPNTLTRVIYNPSEKDKIIHNYHTSDVYSLDAEVVGPADWFSDISDKNILEPLLGTSKVNEINKVFQWINNTNGYLWRLNLKPSEKDERVVGFYAVDDWLYLDCSWSPRLEFPAFRVLQVE